MNNQTVGRGYGTPAATPYDEDQRPSEFDHRGDAERSAIVEEDAAEWAHIEVEMAAELAAEAELSQDGADLPDPGPVADLAPATRDRCAPVEAELDDAAARRPASGVGIGEHPPMSTDKSRREQAVSHEPTRQDKTAAGISQFLGRVFEQLSLSSWFPAAVLVGNGAVLLQMHADRSLSLAAAVEALTDKPLGILVVVLFALVIATVVAQAFEYEVIQLLEGYGWTRGPVRWLAEARIRRHATKLDKLHTGWRKTMGAAFKQARAAMPAGAYDPEELDLLGRDLVNDREVAESDPELLDAVRSIQWREYLHPQMQYRLESFESRFGAYPDRTRLLPTRLGNQLRAAEDDAPVGEGEDVAGFVIRHYDELPQAMRQEHDDYRRRLDMYCTLVLVFLALAVGSLVALHGIAGWWLLGVVTAGYLGMAWVSYLAAIASAKGVGAALREIGQVVKQAQAERELDQQGEERGSALGRLRSLLHRNAV